MSAWRVGSKTGVTLFKGDEIYGILLNPEKAAVVVAWLNAQQRAQAGGLPEVDDLLGMAWTIIANCGVKVSAGWEDQDPEWVAAAEKWRDQYHRWLDKRYGVEAPGGAPEGGAEGDHPAVDADGVRGASGVLGAGHGGDRAPGCYCGDPDRLL